MLWMLMHMLDASKLRTGLARATPTPLTYPAREPLLLLGGTTFL